MATQPTFSAAGDIQWGATALAAANTAKDGTGTTLLVFTAGATYGGYVRAIQFHPAGTNVATVARIFINNGLTPATAANNILFANITLPASTLSEVSSLFVSVQSMNLALPASYRIYCALGTAVSAGYYISVIGSVY